MAAIGHFLVEAFCLCASPNPHHQLLVALTGFEPIFFLGFIISQLKSCAMINHAFISFSAVQIYDISYIHLYSSLSTGILRTHKVTSSPLALQLSC